jgi:hypothetical protein
MACDISLDSSRRVLLESIVKSMCPEKAPSTKISSVMWTKDTKTAESSAMLYIEDVFRLYSMEYQDFNLPKTSSYKASHVFDDENKWIQKEQYIKMLNKEQKIAFD